MVDIFTLAKSTIELGGYELADKLNELTAIMIVGQIDIGEYQQLAELARKHANPDAESSEVGVMRSLGTILEEIEAIKSRITKLEEANGEEVVEEVILDWEPWDPINNPGYKFGTKVRHFGIVYISDFVGNNTWEPGVLGTEAVWRVVK